MKIAAIIAVAAFAAGSVFSPPVQEAIAAVIATDVQCTGCVGANDIASSAVTTTKLASNSVNGGKISDGTISAADLGPDSVGASELKGVSKLIFGSCTITPLAMSSGAGGFACTANGASAGDRVVATLSSVCTSGSASGAVRPLLLYSSAGTNTVLIGITWDTTACPNSIPANFIVYKWEAWNSPPFFEQKCNSVYAVPDGAIADGQVISTPKEWLTGMFSHFLLACQEVPHHIGNNVKQRYFPSEKEKQDRYHVASASSDKWRCDKDQNYVCGILDLCANEGICFSAGPEQALGICRGRKHLQDDRKGLLIPTSPRFDARNSRFVGLVLLILECQHNWHVSVTGPTVEHLEAMTWIIFEKRPYSLWQRMNSFRA